MPVEEWQRKTEQLKLRLPPATAARLRANAADLEMSVGEYVTRLLGAMQEHPEVAAGAVLEDPRGPF